VARREYAFDSAARQRAMIGPPDTALRAARDWIRSPIVNRGQDWPPPRIMLGPGRWSMSHLDAYSLIRLLVDLDAQSDLIGAPEQMSIEATGAAPNGG
jgi:hypothetical protein